MKKIYFLILCGVIFLTGCGESDSANQKNEKANKQNNSEVKSEQSEIKAKSGKNVDYDSLRKKANVAEAASMVGYDGKAIKKDLNKIIDEREKMDKQLKDLDL